MLQIVIDSHQCFRVLLEEMACSKKECLESYSEIITFYNLTHFLEVLFGSGCHDLMPSPGTPSLRTIALFYPILHGGSKMLTSIGNMVTAVWKKADHRFFPIALVDLLLKCRNTFYLLRSFSLY